MQNARNAEMKRTKVEHVRREGDVASRLDSLRPVTMATMAETERTGPAKSGDRLSVIEKMRV